MSKLYSFSEATFETLNNFVKAPEATTFCQCKHAACSPLFCLKSTPLVIDYRAFFQAKNVCPATTYLLTSACEMEGGLSCFV